jgi:hypothetical protein
MEVLEKLASNLGRRDERPNVALAEELVAGGRRQQAAAIALLAGVLGDGSAAVKGDAIKVLVEIGERQPALIAPHLDVFFATLSSGNNRLHWGALCALATLAPGEPKALARRLPEILDAFSRASVIGKDKIVSILCALAGGGYAGATVPHLLEILNTSQVNQTPRYAEEIAAVVPAGEVERLREILQRRLGGIARDSKRAHRESTAPAVRRCLPLGKVCAG